MPYARQNWTIDEIQRLLENPIDPQSGPRAHSAIHAVVGELAENEMFQRARVTNLVCEDRGSGLAMYHEARAHSTMPAAKVAAGLQRALNSDYAQNFLSEFDGKRGDENANLKFDVNFSSSIGRAKLHRSKDNSTSDFDCHCLFVYLKPNPGNADLPIFHTVVPYEKPRKAIPGTKKHPVIAA